MGDIVESCQGVSFPSRYRHGKPAKVEICNFSHSAIFAAWDKISNINPFITSYISSF